MRQVLLTSRHHTKPVTNVISIAVEESYTDSRCHDFLQVREKVGVDKVAGGLKLEVNVVVRASVVEANTKGVLNVPLVEKITVERRRSWVIFGVTDVAGNKTSAQV